MTTSSNTMGTGAFAGLVVPRYMMPEVLEKPPPFDSMEEADRWLEEHGTTG